MPDIDHIKQSALQSIKWTFVTEVAMRLLPPITTLILARLLTPEQFGIIAASMTVITLAQMFQEFGLGKTLIQKEDRLSETANIIFFSNLLLGLLFGMLLFASADYIGIYFNNEQVVSVIRTLCILVVISSFGSVHVALLQRSFNYRGIFIARFTYPIVYAGITLPLAVYGYGVWSLVYGSIIATIVQVILFWIVDPWRPSFHFKVEVAGEVFNFSKWVFLEMLLGWAIMQGDSLILGRFLGIESLGIYWTGVTLLTLIFGLVFNPVIGVIYSAFSRLQSNFDEMQKSFLNIVHTLAAISLPMGFGIFALADPLAAVIFGDKWAGIATVLMILGLKEGMANLVAVNPEMYRALGKPDLNVKQLVLTAILYIPIFIIAAPYGLIIFCIARFAVAAFSLLFHFYLAKAYLGLRFLYMGRCIKMPLAASIIMTTIIYPISIVISPFEGWLGIGKLCACIVIGLVVYIGCMRLFDKNLFRDIFQLVQEVIKR
jgi:O-antigen/teichoic acid export membrane protein